MFINIYLYLDTLVRKLQRECLHGGEGGFYGSLTIGSMKALCNLINISSSDVFLDIGSGSGCWVLYVSLMRGCRSIGIEADEIAAQQSQTALEICGLCKIIQKDIADCSVEIDSLHDVTVAFSYDSVFPPEKLSALQNLLLTLPKLRVAVVAHTELSHFMSLTASLHIWDSKQSKI